MVDLFPNRIMSEEIRVAKRPSETPEPGFCAVCNRVQTSTSRMLDTRPYFLSNHLRIKINLSGFLGGMCPPRFSDDVLNLVFATNETR